MDGPGVCGVAETPVVVCRLPPWHVVCFRLCSIFVPQLSCFDVNIGIGTLTKRIYRCWLKHRCYQCPMFTSVVLHVTMTQSQIQCQTDYYTAGDEALVFCWQCSCHWSKYKTRTQMVIPVYHRWCWRFHNQRQWQRCRHHHQGQMVWDGQVDAQVLLFSDVVVHRQVWPG